MSAVSSPALGWNSVTLGEVCDLHKGTTATLKAIPGQYPLVVTGAERRSSEEYQLDCEAVCLPLVSSTGHGHASINRIHFQSGKFALANIMVALVPKPNQEVLPSFLHLLLSAKKDELLVPLMAGTSNVALRISDVARVTVHVPNLEEQRRIVLKVQQALGALDRAGALHAQTMADFDRLLIALAHRDDMTDDQKRERGWRKLRLGEVMHLDLDPIKVDPSRDYPNLGIYSFAKGLFEKPPISGLATSATVLNRVKLGQFIFSRLFAFEGSYGYVSADYDGFFVSGEYPTFTCNPSECRAEFVYAHFKPERIWRTLSAKSKGLGLRRQRVQPPAILAHEAWVPPMPEQDRLAEVLTAQRRFAASDTFKKDADALRRSILSKAFRGEL